ncbi:hypothetical protein V5O48_012825 [Marasmius crinis-equi]|uniref:Uncharacterized protein n=1 Tax=Marasmius crinis-equi TaxID=585013 RepID=A0ABR3F1T9_9AGAR
MPEIPVLSRNGQHGTQRPPAAITSLDEHGKITLQDKIDAVMYAFGATERYVRYKDPNDPNYVDELGVTEAEEYKIKVLAYDLHQDWEVEIKKEIKNKLKDEIKSELKDEIKKEIKEEMAWRGT